MSAFVYATPALDPAPVTFQKGARAYRQTQIQSRTPMELIVLLYDESMRQLGQARDALGSGDLVTKRDALSRGLAIIQELQQMLDMNAGGEVAERLDGLYTYILGKAYEANAQRDPAGFDECIRLLGTLRAAWAELAAMPPSAA